MEIVTPELLLRGALRVLQRHRNSEVLLTLFQPEGADYAHHITASTSRFENLKTSLLINCCPGSPRSKIKRPPNIQGYFKVKWTIFEHKKYLEFSNLENTSKTLLLNQFSRSINQFHVHFKFLHPFLPFTQNYENNEKPEENNFVPRDPKEQKNGFLINPGELESLRVSARTRPHQSTLQTSQGCTDCTAS